ncbi:MAG: hypothetical protein A2Y90_00660 [Chloroflexi bacterium RBG_13_52_12]|nr:MAG: hypothetical protein A2Y90_00660 [Chloroflexi bacterium RBG_13_52_12]
MLIKDFAEKFISGWLEALLKGNFKTFESLIDSSFIYHHAPGPDIVGREAYKQVLIATRKGFPDGQTDWKYLTSEGNVFALEYKGHGRFTGEMPGLSIPHGKEVTSHYLCLFRIKNGKVVEGWANGSFIITD